MKYLPVIVLGLLIGTTTVFASNNSSRVQTPEMKICIASAVSVRDNAINTARMVYDAAVKNAIDTQKIALSAIPVGISREDSKIARQAARTVYSTSVKNARTSQKSARSLATSQYKAAVQNCKTSTPPIIPINPSL